jgi:hypothetical protein
MVARQVGWYFDWCKRCGAALCAMPKKRNKTLAQGDVAEGLSGGWNVAMPYLHSIVVDVSR